MRDYMGVLGWVMVTIMALGIWKTGEIMVAAMVFAGLRL